MANKKTIQKEAQWNKGVYGIGIDHNLGGKMVEKAIYNIIRNNG